MCLRMTDNMQLPIAISYNTIFVPITTRTLPTTWRVISKLSTVKSFMALVLVVHDKNIPNVASKRLT